MPVVPFNNSGTSNAKRENRPLEVPTAQEPWVLMAAAQMDAQGRLVAKPPTDEADSVA